MEGGEEMFIKIENFRGIENLELDLPDAGIVQLAGDSEAGKTTILEAFVWALYGRVKNVTPLAGSKKTSVTVNYQGLLIVRTKTPNTLSCNGVQDEVAQALINKTLAEPDHFELSSYVQQKLKNCFLNLSPKKQLDNLNALSLEVDVDKLKDRIKEIKKEKTDISNSLTLKLAQETDRRDDLERNLQKLIDSKKEGATVDGLEELMQKGKEHRENQQKSVELRKELDSLKAIGEAVAPAQYKVKSIEEKIESLLQTVEPIKQEKAECEIKIENLTPKIKAEVLESNRRELLTLQSFKTMVVNFENTNMPESIEAPLNLCQLKEDNERRDIQIGELNVAWAQARNSLKSLQDEVVCPHCQGRLSVNGLTLKAVEGLSLDLAITDHNRTLKNLQNDIDEHRKAIKINNDRIKSITEYQRAYDEWLGRGAKVKEFADSNGLSADLSSDALASIITSLQESIESQVVHVKELELLRKTLSALESKAKDTQLKYDKLLVEWELANKTFCETSERASEAGDKIYDLSLKLASVEIDLSHVDLGSLMSKAEEIKDEIRRVQAIKDLNDAIAVQNEKRSQTEHKAAEALNEVNRCDRLLSELQHNQLRAIQHLSISLNLSVEKYINEFFPDCGTSIVVQAQKLNKDGSLSDKIGVDIVHKGVPCTIDTFSGGAENRAIVAFQLAMSEVINSPVLLLDEPLVGVHATLRDDIYTSLRTFASNKLIIVVEHGAPANLFDLVVEV